jgi:multiple sugar transport system substrate-binding protein
MNLGLSLSLQNRRRLKTLVGFSCILAAGWWAVAWRGPRLTIAIPQGVEGLALREAAKEFGNNKGISVEVLDWPYDKLFSEVASELTKASGRFDAILLDDPWLPDLMAQGGRSASFCASGKNLERLFSDDGGQGLFSDQDLPKADRKDFLKPTLDVCQDPYQGGTYYALPFVGNSQLFCYRATEPSKRPPSNWEDILNASQSRRNSKTQRDGYIMRLGRGNSVVTDFMPIIWDQCPQCLCEKELTPMDPAVMQAFQFLADLGQQRRDKFGQVKEDPDRNGKRDFSVVTTDDFDLAVQLAKGQATMAIVWSAWAMTMASLPEIGQLEFARMPGRGQPVLGAWLLAIAGNSDHKYEAKEFLKFATTKKWLRQSALKYDNPPPRRSVLEDPELQRKFKSFKWQLESLECSRPRTRTPCWRTIETRLGDVLWGLYAGPVTAKEAFYRANAEIAGECTVSPTNQGNCHSDPEQCALAPGSSVKGLSR